MKLWLSGLALILLAAVVKGNYREELQKIDMACRVESHVSEDELKAFLKGDIKDNASNALKCHMKCIMEKQGHWSNGGFDNAAALKKLDEMPNLKEHQKDVVKVLEDCKDKKGTDECDTAYLITRCIVEHHPAAQ